MLNKGWWSSYLADISCHETSVMTECSESYGIANLCRQKSWCDPLSHPIIIWGETPIMIMQYWYWTIKLNTVYVLTKSDKFLKAVSVSHMQNEYIFHFFFFLFDLILYTTVNNLSVMSGWVFLGWTSTKQGSMCLAQGHNTVTLVRL